MIFRDSPILLYCGRLIVIGEYLSPESGNVLSTICGVRVIRK